MRRSRPEVLDNNNILGGLVKLGNEFLQLYYQSTQPRVCSWEVFDIFMTAKCNLTKVAIIKSYTKLAIAYTKECPAFFKEKRRKGNTSTRLDFSFVYFK